MSAAPTERDPLLRKPAVQVDGVPSAPDPKRRLGPLELSASQRRRALVGVWIGTFLGQSLNMSLVPTMMPSISSEFQKFHQAQWLGTAYLLATCTFTPLYGRLSNVMGRRGANLTAICFAAAGTIGCGLSTSMEGLIAARFLAGIGGGGLFTTSTIIVSDMYTLRGLQAVSTASVLPQLFHPNLTAEQLGMGLGGPFGGVVTDLFGWRAAFVIQTPLFVIAALMTQFNITYSTPGKSKGTKEVLKRIDYFGSLTLLVAVGSLLVFLSSRYNESLPLHDPRVLVPLILAVIFFLAFLVVEIFVAPEPVMAPALLRQKVPVLVSASNFLVAACNFSVTYFFPMWFQVVTLESASTAGLHLMPNSVSMSTGAVFAGWVMHRTGTTVDSTRLDTLDTTNFAGTKVYHPARALSAFADPDHQHSPDLQTRAGESPYNQPSTRLTRHDAVRWKASVPPTQLRSAPAAWPRPRKGFGFALTSSSAGKRCVYVLGLGNGEKVSSCHFFVRNKNSPRVSFPDSVSRLASCPAELDIQQLLKALLFELYSGRIGSGTRVVVVRMADGGTWDVCVVVDVALVRKGRVGFAGGMEFCPRRRETASVRDGDERGKRGSEMGWLGAVPSSVLGLLRQGTDGRRRGCGVGHVTHIPRSSRNHDVGLTMSAAPTERDPLLRKPAVQVDGVPSAPDPKRRLGPLELSASQRRRALVGVWIGTFLGQSLNMSLVPTMMPSISSEFQKFHQAQWLGTAYLLATCTFTPLYGRLSNVMGRRGANLTAICFAAAGTIGCGLSTSMEGLIAARFLAGIGGGGLFTTSTIIVSDMYTLRGLQAVSTASVLPQLFHPNLTAEQLGMGLGGPFGGVVTDLFGWRAAFVIQTPLFVIAALMTQFNITYSTPGKSKGTKEVLKRIDYFGSLTLLVAVGSLLVFLSSRYNESLPLHDPRVLVPLILAVIFFLAFLVVEIFVAPEPVMAPALLRQKVPVLVSASNFLVAACNFSVTYFFPMWFQVVTLESASTAGLHLMPNSVSMSTGAVFAGWVMHRTGTTVDSTRLDALDTTQFAGTKVYHPARALSAFADPDHQHSPDLQTRAGESPYNQPSTRLTRHDAVRWKASVPPTQLRSAPAAWPRPRKGFGFALTSSSAGKRCVYVLGLGNGEKVSSCHFFVRNKNSPRVSFPDSVSRLASCPAELDIQQLLKAVLFELYSGRIGSGTRVVVVRMADGGTWDVCVVVDVALVRKGRVGFAGGMEFCPRRRETASVRDGDERGKRGSEMGWLGAVPSSVLGLLRQGTDGRRRGCGVGHVTHIPRSSRNHDVGLTMSAAPTERDPLLRKPAVQVDGVPSAPDPKRRLGPLELSASQRRRALVGVWIGTFLGQSLNMSLVPTMMPSISSEFQKFHQAQWLGTAYLLATCTFTPLYGRLSNVMGRRGANLTAICFAAAGTIGCGLSTSMEGLIAARFLAGIGGGGLFTTSTIIVSDMYTLRGLQAVSTASVLPQLFHPNLTAEQLGMGLGGPFGGVVTDLFGWRAAFVIQTPLFVIAALMTQFNITYSTPGKSKGTKEVLKRIDYFGSLTLLVAVGSLLVFLSSRYNESLPLHDPRVLVPLILAVIFFLAFLVVEIFVAPEPVMAPALLRQKVPVLVSASNFLVAACNFSVTYFFPMWFQVVTLESASTAGLHLMPNSVSMSTGAVFAGWVMHRTGTTVDSTRLDTLDTTQFAGTKVYHPARALSAFADPDHQHSPDLQTRAGESPYNQPSTRLTRHDAVRWKASVPPTQLRSAPAAWPRPRKGFGFALTSSSAGKRCVYVLGLGNGEKVSSCHFFVRNKNSPRVSFPDSVSRLASCPAELDIQQLLKALLFELYSGRIGSGTRVVVVRMADGGTWDVCVVVDVALVRKGRVGFAGGMEFCPRRRETASVRDGDERGKRGSEMGWLGAVPSSVLGLLRQGTDGRRRGCGVGHVTHIPRSSRNHDVGLTMSAAPTERDPLLRKPAVQVDGVPSAPDPKRRLGPLELSASQRRRALVGGVDRDVPRGEWFRYASRRYAEVQQSLNMSLVPTMMPSISSEFQKFHQAQWLGTAYLLATCTFTPLYGRLSNVMGRRGANLTAICFAAAGTIGCGLSTSMEGLIAARFLAGIGGGGLFTTSTIIVSDMYTLRGLQAVSTASVLPQLFHPNLTAEQLGMGLGGPFGGVVTDLFGWRAAFVIQTPLFVIAALMTQFNITYSTPGKSKGTKEVLKRIDYFGSLTLLVAVGSLLVFLSSRYNESLPLHDPRVLVPLILAVIFFLAFLVVEIFVAPEPVMAPALLRQKVPVLVSASNFLVAACNFSVTYFFPMWFQVVTLESASTAGLHLMPNSVSMSTGAVFAGWVMHRTGTTVDSTRLDTLDTTQFAGTKVYHPARALSAFADPDHQHSPDLQTRAGESPYNQPSTRLTRHDAVRWKASVPPTQLRSAPAAWPRPRKGFGFALTSSSAGKRCVYVLGLGNGEKVSSCHFFVRNKNSPRVSFPDSVSRLASCPAELDIQQLLKALLFELYSGRIGSGTRVVVVRMADGGTWDVCVVVDVALVRKGRVGFAGGMEFCPRRRETASVRDGDERGKRGSEMGWLGAVPSSVLGLLRQGTDGRRRGCGVGHVTHIPRSSRNHDVGLTMSAAPTERDPLLRKPAVQVDGVPSAPDPKRRLGPLELSASQRRRALVGVWIGTFLGQSLNMSLVPTMMPSISSEFQKFHQAQWLGTAYLLATCTFTPLYGRLSNVMGRRGANLTAICFAAAGTIGCGLSTSMEGLIAARFLAGIGGGGLFTTSTIIVSDMYTLRGLQAVSTASVLPQLFHPNLTAEQLGMGLGGPFGGVVTDLFGWRAAFVIQTPLFVIAALMTQFNITYSTPGKSKGTKEVLKRIDYFGSLTLLVAVGSLLVFLSSRYNESLPLHDPRVLVPLILAVIFFLAFLVVEIFVAPEPVMAPALLRQKVPVLVSASNFLVAACNFSVTYFFPMWFQVVTLESASTAGLHLMPNSVSMSTGAVFAGWVMHRTGVGPRNSTVTNPSFKPATPSPIEDACKIDHRRLDPTRPARYDAIRWNQSVPTQPGLHPLLLQTRDGPAIEASVDPARHDTTRNDMTPFAGKQVYHPRSSVPRPLLGLGLEKAMSAAPTERDPLLRKPTVQVDGVPSAPDPKRRLGPLELSASQRRRALVGVWIGTFLGSLNMSLVPTMMPSISSEFQKFHQAQWLGTAYLLATCTFTPLYGRLSNVMGRRGANLTAICFAAAGTIGCGLSTSMEGLIAARFLAGIGGGGLFTTSSIIVSDMYTLRDRGLIQGLASCFNGLGMGLGGPFGGVVTDLFGWRAAFVIQTPLFVIAALMTQFNITYSTPGKSKGTKEVLKRIDYFGSLTLLVAVGSLLVFLSSRYMTPRVLVPLILAVIFFLAFLVVEIFVAPEPVMAPALLRQKVPVLVSASNFLVAACNFSVTYFFPMWFQVVTLESASTAGLHLMPNSVSMSTGSVFAGWVMHRTGTTVDSTRLDTLDTTQFAGTKVCPPSPGFIRFCFKHATGLQSRRDQRRPARHDTTRNDMTPFAGKQVYHPRSSVPRPLLGLGLEKG
ncbi:Vacuolar amino acid permease [Mycena chlorophos]|uniref:Vacuolar amino acid permease n=1 Tax=Mycena chlorophos TaxID=658473 RepID=A0A8H6SAL3_MYCCL|nr:Vacuolar amino acid permease [Mycena chlorophos]